MFNPLADIINSLRRLDFHGLVRQKGECKLDEETHESRRVEDELVARSIPVPDDRVET